MKSLFCKVSVEGVTPIIIHNGRLANPLDEYAKKLKALTSKRKKTDEDIENIMQLQWRASLYWNDDIGLYMPVENLLAALHKACKKHKMGNTVTGFIFHEKLGFPIVTDNHSNLEGLTRDPANKFIKAVTIQRSKTLSCRAKFENWKIDFDFEIDQGLLTEEDVTMILNTMTNRIGFGVWAPHNMKPGNHGKFKINNLEFFNN